MLSVGSQVSSATPLTPHKVKLFPSVIVKLPPLLHTEELPVNQKCIVKHEVIQNSDKALPRKLKYLTKVLFNS